MAAYGLGALAGWFDYDGDADMNEWQAREHIGERVAVPGFIRGRRFESPLERPQYFMFYETDDVAVLSSAPYLERLNDPTPWSRACAPGLSNMTRSVCRIAASAGAIDGGWLATIECIPVAQRAAELRAWIADHLLRSLTSRPGVYAAHLLEPDDAASTIETTEKQIRTAPDRVSGWILVVEGRNRELLGGAVSDPELDAGLKGHGAAEADTARIYQLSFAVHR